MRTICRVVLMVLWLASFASALPKTARSAEPDVVPRREVMQLGNGPIYDTAWHPGGYIFAVAGRDGVRIYSPGFSEVARLMTGPTAHIAWSPDGEYLAGLVGGESLVTWRVRVAQGIAISRISTVPTPAAKSLMWGQHGLAITLNSGELRFLNPPLDSGYPDFAENVDALALHPDRDSYVAAMESGELILISSLGERTLFQNANSITALAYAPDGTYLAVGDSNGQILILQADSGKVLHTLSGQRGDINSLAWNSDGTRLASGSGSRFDGSEVRLWDVQSGDPLGVYPGTAAIKHVEWRPGTDQLTAAGADNLVRTWDTDNGQVVGFLQGYMSEVEALAWSPDGSELAAAGHDGVVRIWHEGRPVASLQGHVRGVNALAWSPDGLMLASAGWDNVVRIWMRPTGKVRAVIRRHKDRIWDMAWSPDGMYLATASRDTTLRIWDPYDGTLVATFSQDQSELTALAWSPDGLRIAASSDAGSVWIWELEQAEPVYALLGHDRYVWSLAWHDQRLISASWHDGLMLVWDTESGEHLRTYRSVGVLAVRWSPSGQYFATTSSDGTIRVFEDFTGLVVQALYGHRGEVYAIAWKPDGSQLATGGLDGTIRIWGGAH